MHKFIAAIVTAVVCLAAACPSPQIFTQNLTTSDGSEILFTQEPGAEGFTLQFNLPDASKKYISIIAEAGHVQQQEDYAAEPIQFTEIQRGGLLYYMPGEAEKDSIYIDFYDKNHEAIDRIVIDMAKTKGEYSFQRVGEALYRLSVPEEILLLGAE